MQKIVSLHNKKHSSLVFYNPIDYENAKPLPSRIRKCLYGDYFLHFFCLFGCSLYEQRS